jgi:hypothetical protein
MKKFVKKIVTYFDLYGEPVASLNVDGASVLTTVPGGVVGFVVVVMIVWFSILRGEIMINRKHARKIEVNQGLDLMAADTPVVNFRDYGFKIGVGAAAVIRND